MRVLIPNTSSSYTITCENHVGGVGYSYQGKTAVHSKDRGS